MKKFHKRAAVFLTAATLAGLPAGAFFYSSPGSLTVWADNVEVESSEESSPEDVDFSDESEAEILADPVEQAQEDAGNDVTETPEVGITFTEPEGWQTDTATVKIQVEDTKNTGAFSIAKVEARLSENGGWSDITGNMEVSISSNCSIYVRVTDQNGNTYEQNRYIECFDKTKPTIIAAAKNGILIVQGVDAESGIAALYVNGNEFTELTNNTLNVRLQKADTSYEYFTLQAKDKAGNMSEIYKVGNPYYENPDAVKENTEVSGTEQNAASLPADGTASKPTSAKVYVGKRNYYCSGSDCSFTLWKNNRFFESQGKTLDEATVRKLLSEKQVHFKDLVSEKTKRKYEATIKMEVSETGNPKFQLIFPERKKGKKNEE